MTEAPAIPAYKPKLDYEFTITRKVRLGAIILGAMETHTAKGAILNQIVEQEGADAIATAERR